MRWAVVVLVSCGNSSEPSPAPPPTPPTFAPSHQGAELGFLLQNFEHALATGHRAQIERMLFTDEQIRWACRDAPHVADGLIAQRDAKGSELDACFAMPWGEAKDRKTGSIGGNPVRGCDAEVLRTSITARSGKAIYSVSIQAMRIGGKYTGLTMLPRCTTQALEP